MSTFTLASLGAYALVVLSAALSRGGVFAIFAAVLLGIHTAVSTALFAQVPESLSLVPYALQAAVYLHFASLTRPRMRPPWYRVLVTYPALWFVSATFLAFPWAIAAAVVVALRARAAGPGRVAVDAPGASDAHARG